MSYLATINEPGANCHVERRWPIFGAKLEACRLEMFLIVNFLQSGMVFEIENPFSCIFKAIFCEKNLPHFSAFSALLT